MTAPALRSIPGGQATTPATVPAHNLDAEATLVGMVLLGAVHPDDVRAYLPPDAWFGVQHRHMFEAICAVADAGEEIGALTVHHQLNMSGRLRDVGGGAALGAVMDRTPDHAPAHAITLVKIILDCWALRRAEVLAREQYTQARAGQVDVGAFLRARIEELETVERARNVSISGTDMHSGLKEDFEARQDRAERGVTTRCPTGIDGVDAQMGGWPRQWFAILTAESGGGKTAFGLSACVGAASTPVDRGGGSALFLSVELTREQTRERLMQNLGYLTKEQMERGGEDLVPAACALASLPIYVDDVTTTDEVRASVRRHLRECQRRGVPLRLVVVDYLQILRLPASKRTASMNTDQTLDAIAEEFKDMRKAPDLRDLTFLVLSQINKEGTVRGGGSVIHKADQSLALKRDNQDDHGPVVGVTLTFGKGRGVGGDPVELDLHRRVGLLTSRGVTP